MSSLSLSWPRAYQSTSRAMSSGGRPEPCPLHDVEAYAAGADDRNTGAPGRPCGSGDGANSGDDGAAERRQGIEGEIARNDDGAFGGNHGALGEAGRP